MRSAEEVRHEFTAQPVDGKIIGAISQFTKHIVALALKIQKEVPDCQQREVALQRLLECKQAVVQSITHHKMREKKV